MTVAVRTNGERLGRLQESLKRKEKMARSAKDKGMHSTFGLLMTEISELKRRVKKCQMGS